MNAVPRFQTIEECEDEGALLDHLEALREVANAIHRRRRVLQARSIERLGRVSECTKRRSGLLAVLCEASSAVVAHEVMANTSHQHCAADVCMLCRLATVLRRVAIEGDI